MPHTPDPQSVLKSFFSRDDIRIPIARLKSALPSGAALWVIGGAPRNALIESIHGRSPLTEDIDVFIADVAPDLNLAGLELDGELRRTELGGIRWLSGRSHFSFDIGLLTRFLIIEKFRLAPTTGSLLAAIDFDVNAVMWDWDTQQVMTSGCVEAVTRRVMDFNTTLVFDRALLAYRILLTHHKTGFWLSNRVFDWVKNAVDFEVLKKLKAILDAKLGKSAARAVMAQYDAICRCRSYGGHLARNDWGKAGGPANSGGDALV